MASPTSKTSLELSDLVPGSGRMKSPGCCGSGTLGCFAGGRPELYEAIVNSNQDLPSVTTGLMQSFEVQNQM